MRRSFTYCMLDPDYRAKYKIGMFAAMAYTLAVAAIIAVCSSAPSKAADPYEKFDLAIASWNKACQHQVWPYLDSQCAKGADVSGIVRIIGGPQVPPEFYREVEGLVPSDSAKPCVKAGKACLSAQPVKPSHEA
jgi:hypothetical protein